MSEHVYTIILIGTLLPQLGELHSREGICYLIFCYVYIFIKLIDISYDFL